MPWLQATGKLWVLRNRGELIGIEPETGEIASRTTLPGGARRLLGDDDALWAISGRGRRLMRVDPSSGHVDAQVRLPGKALAIACDADTVWVGCRDSLRRKNRLSRVDAGTGKLRASRSLPACPRALAYGMDALWIACESKRRDGVIYRWARTRASWKPRWSRRTGPSRAWRWSGSRALALMSTATSHTADGGSSFILDGGGGGGGGHGGGGGGAPAGAEGTKPQSTESPSPEPSGPGHKNDLLSRAKAAV